MNKGEKRLAINALNRSLYWLEQWEDFALSDEIKMVQRTIKGTKIALNIVKEVKE